MSDGLLRDRSETGKPGPMNNLSECCWYLQAECKCHRLNRSSLFPLVPAAWVCFVFSQHFKVKPEKIKSWNHYCERSEHKYFIIWYFLCKIEFMHSDAGAVRIQKYQATVSVSWRSKFTLWWRKGFFCWMSKLRPDFEQWWVKNGTAALLCSLCSSCLA